MTLPRAGVPALAPTFAAALLIAAALLLVSLPTAALGDPSCPAKRMNIVAHEDDDLIFQNPAVLEAIAAGNCVRTVYVTAGDAGKGETYWRAREEGPRAAYAVMAGVVDSWTTSSLSPAGHTVQLKTLTGRPTVSQVYLRLPDGGGGAGVGYAVNGSQSVPRLWRSQNPQPASLGSISSINALDGSATYTYEGLLGTLQALIAEFEPDVIATQNFSAEFGGGDHADHIAVARFVQLANAAYKQEHVLRSYMDYESKFQSQNVFEPQLGKKLSAYFAYAVHDSNEACTTQVQCESSFYSEYWSWLRRQYSVTQSAVPGADAGPDQSVTSKAAVTLDGSSSSDPLGHSLSYEWKQTGGSAVSLSDASAVKPKFTAPTGPGALTFSLVVKSSEATSLADSVTVNVAAPLYALKVSLSGNGSGTVTSSPSGISCGTDCEGSYEAGTKVTLTPTPAAGSEFKGWSGACTGSGSCEVTMSAAKSVGAEFALQRHQLSVAKSGAGVGTVTSSPAGISCGATCSALFDHGTEVTLTASPAAGSEFKGWSGACTGTGSCKVTMSAAKSVGAEFAPVPKFALKVDLSGNGSGTVTSAPGGIECETDCEEAYEQGTSVTLSATPAAGSEFKGWSGASCSGTGDCVVAMSSAKEVTAQFALQRHGLSVSHSGAGNGAVSSSPAGINCGGNCAASFDDGAEVTLTATPSAGSTFVKWTGACVGSGSCKVTMSSAKSVGAEFALQRHDLTVARSGSGSGTVTSSPAGIDCGSVCLAEFAEGTSVTLTGISAEYSKAVVWADCPGTVNASNQCEVSMAQAREATARFDLDQHTLTVARAGSDAGTVTSSPAGIACGSKCTASFDHGATMILTVSAKPADTISWSGCDEIVDGDKCRVTMNADREVSAIVTPPPAPPIPIPTPPVPTPEPTPEDPAKPDTRLLKAKIGPGTAKLVFAAQGDTTRFRCALAHPGDKLAYKPCSSPKTYRHLEPGRYVFKVKAVGPGGADPVPITKRFRVPFSAL